MIRTASLIAASALALACGPALAQEHEAHAHDAAAHGHRHAPFESGRFHVRVEGEASAPGRDLILIPGLSSHPDVFNGLVQRLEPGWRVHALHIQGFAGAPVEDNAEGPVAAPVAEELARYIAEHGLQKPVVIGHSMGGTIGMMLAARHPDSVGKLMVVDMIPFMGPMFGGPTATAESVAPVADQVRAGMLAAPAEAYDAQLSATLAGMIATESQRAGPLDHARRSDRTASANAYRELIVTDLRPELPNITAPVEVLYVAFNAPGMTPEMTDGIYRASFATLPSAELKRIDDSAHFIMLDQPEVFAAEVNAFLD
ncbi:MAG: alpha/beta fold hydrolase [Brevundimonas sp.]